jgi:hypothetical protein
VSLLTAGSSNTLMDSTISLVFFNTTHFLEFY